MVIIAVVSEMIFKAAIEKAAEAEGADCLVLADEDPVLAALQEGTPDALFIDIGSMALDGPGLVQKIKQNPSTRNIPVVAFGNSLRADLMQDAKEMGADLVLAKSAFHQQLPELIRHYLRP
jgi:CheY-like chemotaxis protein